MPYLLLLLLLSFIDIPHTFASTQKTQGDYDQAISYYNRALAVLTKVLGEQHPHTLQVKENIAFVKREQGSAFADL